MGRLEDKVAFVTGGGRGIGRGICPALAAEGATVVVADLDMTTANQTAGELENAGRKALALALDVTSRDSAEAAVERAAAEFGGVHILVNNAGVLGEHSGRDVTLDDWDLALDVNLKGIWIMTQAVLPVFRARGGGKIVNIASIAGRHGTGVHPHYSASHPHRCTPAGATRFRPTTVAAPTSESGTSRVISGVHRWPIGGTRWLYFTPTISMANTTLRRCRLTPSAMRTSGSTRRRPPTQARDS